MIYILVAVIILQFVYSIYKDESFKREREKLQLKLMSKTPQEYKEAIEKPEKIKPKKKEKDPYIPIEDVPTEKLLKAEDAL